MNSPSRTSISLPAHYVGKNIRKKYIPKTLFLFLIPDLMSNRCLHDEKLVVCSNKKKLWRVPPYQKVPQSAVSALRGLRLSPNDWGKGLDRGFEALLAGGLEGRK